MSRSFHLRSAFRPTYNMAANLVRTYDAATAHQLLTLSFAQFQADRDVVRTSDDCSGNESGWPRYGRRPRARSATSRSTGRSSMPGRGAVDLDDPIELAMAALRPGAVIHASKGKDHGPVASSRPRTARAVCELTAITPSGRSIQLVGADFDSPPQQIGSVSSRARTRRTARTIAPRSGCGSRRRSSSRVRPGSRRSRIDPVRYMAPGRGRPRSRATVSRRRVRPTGSNARSSISSVEWSARTRHSAREFDGVLAVLDGAWPRRRRRVAADRGRRDARPGVPRERPPRHRDDPQRRARRCRCRHARRARLDVRVRAPVAGRPSDALVPRQRGPASLAVDRAAQRGTRAPRARARI